MAMLPISHPDILNFIRCKNVEGSLTNFNLSVSVPDSFMEAVMGDDIWHLRDPSNDVVIDTVSAVALFDEIVESGRKNGEPGVVFIDVVNRDNPCPSLFQIEATNPCVTGDTVISTSVGPAPVHDLLGKSFFNPDGVPVPGGFFETKVVDSLTIVRTLLGFSIKCTPDHRLMTAGGWKSAADLVTSADSLSIIVGTYHTAGHSMAEIPRREWSQRVAPILVCGDPRRERDLDINEDEMLHIINCSTFLGAVCLLRATWTMSGRPRDCIVFKLPTSMAIVGALQLALLRLGVVTEMSRNLGTEIVLSPKQCSIAIFNGLTLPNTDDLAATAVWNILQIRQVWDPVVVVETVAAKGVRVYDATTLPSANKPELWTGAFLSHNCSEVPLSNYESTFFFVQEKKFGC